MMNIHIRTVVEKMEEALRELKAEASLSQPSQQRIQEQAIALRSYADLLATTNERETERSVAAYKPQPEVKRVMAAENMTQIAPKNDGESLFDF